MATSSSSHFQQTVYLYDWWLTKSDKDFQGKRLAVAGFTSRELQPVRLFTSAPIVKRYDVFTLETADGISVIVKGFINKSRTTDNGFPSKVFDHFVFGFPINWEKYAEKLLEEGCSGSAGIESKNASILQNECETSVAASPAKIDVDYIKKNDTGNLPPSLGCHINAASSLEDNVVVADEAPRRTMGKSNTKGSVNIELSRKCGDTVQSGEETNQSTPCMVNADTANGTPNNFRSKKSSYCLRNRNDDQKQKPNRRFVKHKNKESAPEAFGSPDGEQLEGSSSHPVIHSGGKMDTSEAMPSRSMGRIAERLSRNLRSKEKKEECSYGKKTKRKIIFDTHATPPTEEIKEKVSITSSKSSSFKRSRSGRVLVPTLDFWRNQIPVYDMDGTLTGIQEDLNVVKPSRGSRSEPQKKRRKIT